MNDPDCLNSHALVAQLEKMLRKENICRNARVAEEDIQICIAASMQSLIHSMLYYCSQHDRDTYLEFLHMIIGRMRCSRHAIEAAEVTSAMK
jgi:hypothetical protein